MRRGIADLHRRAQVSRRATERYLDALTKVDDETPPKIMVCTMLACNLGRREAKVQGRLASAVAKSTA